MTDEWTHGEIVRSLQRIERAMGALDSKVDGLSAGFVPRAEWQVWAQSRDREIADLKAARAPWWTWATVIIAAVSLIVTIVTQLLH